MHELKHDITLIIIIVIGAKDMTGKFHANKLKPISQAYGFIRRVFRAQELRLFIIISFLVS